LKLSKQFGGDFEAFSFVILYFRNLMKSQQ
jgi:hypothetical protein